VSQFSRDDFSEADLKIIEEVLRRKGVSMTPQSGTQAVLSAAGSALGAGADAAASNRSAGLQAAVDEGPSIAHGAMTRCRSGSREKKSDTQAATMRSAIFNARSI
jgi:hypothetical protein